MTAFADGRWLRAMLAAFVLLATNNADATQTLTTPSYTFIVDVRCEEGVLGCPDVACRAEHRESGDVMMLSGEEVFRTCGDGVTPCQFLYYRFEQGGREYLLNDDGNLTIRRGGAVQIQESGQWDYGQ